MKSVVAALQTVAVYLVTKVLFRLIPSLKVSSSRLQYNVASKLFTHKDYKFINCGFARLNGEDEDVDFSQPENLYSLWERLYQEVTGGVDVKGKTALEIGCGRGGGSEYIVKKLGAAAVTAVDLSDVAIELCKASYDVEGLHFLRGNACDLPFSNDTFDVVVNVESSHCYPSQEQFFREVERVLQPGGVFCFADITESAEHTRRIEQLFSELGFVTRQKQNITQNVVASLRLIEKHRAFADAYSRWQSPTNRHGMKFPLMVIHNTLMDLTSGKEYQRWVLEKPRRLGVRVTAPASADARA